MYGQYKRITGLYSGVFTGKGLTYGGSLARREATGYGLCYFTDEMLKAQGQSFVGKKVVISGSGNVALYACQKAIELGATVVAMSDSSGYVVDTAGIDFATMRHIKEDLRGRVSQYAEERPTASFHSGCKGIWTVPCDIALPCATQNELDGESAKCLVQNGVLSVAEGANMPCTPEAIDIFLASGTLFAPAKAANAGGVATSGLEMTQNAMKYSWSFKEVDSKLKAIMQGIYANVSKAAATYGTPGNLVAGANIAGFLKVAEAMLAQGVV